MTKASKTQKIRKNIFEKGTKSFDRLDLLCYHDRMRILCIIEFPKFS